MYGMNTQVSLLKILKDNKFSAGEDVFRVAAFILRDERKLLEAAVEVLDQDKQPIRRLQSGSCTRHFWIVNGSKGSKYICFEDFCPCRSFEENSMRAAPVNTVPSTTSTALCKHLVAIAIAEAIQAFVPLEVIFILSCIFLL